MKHLTGVELSYTWNKGHGPPPIHSFPWGASQIALIPGILKQTTSFKAMETRGRCSKFLWDHIGHGRNQHKWNAANNLADPCPLCGYATDDMRHITVEYPNPAMVEARNKCWIDCRKVLDHGSALGIAGRYARAMIETMEAGRTRDTHALMLGRPLDYQVRPWDHRFGPQTTAQGDIFRKLACKILSITLMAIIGLWMCRGSERQNIQLANKNVQQILFDEEDGQDNSRQEDYSTYHDQYTRNLE